MHMPDTYEKLLEEAYSHITERSDSGERFNIPAVKVYYEGKTTVLENFNEIYQTLERTRSPYETYAERTRYRRQD